MSCGNNNAKNCYNKSCQRYYNNATQTLTASTTSTLTIQGNRVVDTGISIETEAQAYQTVKCGLYHIEGDVVINATTGGNVTLQILMDGNVLPCTIKTVTLGVGSTEIHTETEINIVGCCCNNTHTFEYELVVGSAVVGSVTNFCSGVTKLA